MVMRVFLAGVIALFFIGIHNVTLFFGTLILKVPIGNIVTVMLRMMCLLYLTVNIARSLAISQSFRLKNRLQPDRKLQGIKVFVILISLTQFLDLIFDIWSLAMDYFTLTTTPDMKYNVNQDDKDETAEKMLLFTNLMQYISCIRPFLIFLEFIGLAFCRSCSTE